MQDKYGMTSHKLLWHLDRLNAWCNGDRIVPKNMQLGITNGCNLSCSYCYGAALMGKVDVKDRTVLPTDVITKLFSDAKTLGVKSISLVGEGENTLHPYFYSILKHARDINLDLGIATNGLPLKLYKTKEVLESFVWMRFSLGAANKEGYKLVHGANMFEYFTKVVSLYVNEKIKNNLQTTLGLQMVVIKTNIDQIVPIAKLGKELGVDYFVAKPCSDTPDGKLEVPHADYLNLEDLFKEAESYSTDKYSVVIKRNKFDNLGKFPYKVCRATQFIIQINAKGDVAPCGHLLGYRNGLYHMGNLNEQSLHEILSSDKYWEIQNKVQKLDLNSECETNCLHYYINSFLDGLTNVPQHVNFV